jgi:hypothetical protein
MWLINNPVDFDIFFYLWIDSANWWFRCRQHITAIQQCIQLLICEYCTQRTLQNTTLFLCIHTIPWRTEGNTEVKQMFIGLCSVIYSYSTTNKMHLFLKLFILVKCSTCFGRSFRPSYGAQNCTYSNRHMSNSCCYLLLAGTFVTATCRYRGK